MQVSLIATQRREVNPGQLAAKLTAKLARSGVPKDREGDLKMESEDRPAPDGDELNALIERINGALRDTISTLDVQARLEASDEEYQTPIAAVAAGFLYVERFGRQSTGNGHFIPIAQLGEFSNPPPIDQMPAWVPTVWETCAALAAEPVARARLHDLCFEARQGNRRDHARAAAEAYLEIAGHYPPPASDEVEHVQSGIVATHSLQRALELARRTGQTELAERIILRLIAAAGLALDDQNSGPGIVLGFIEPLCAEKSEPSELDGLLVRARERYRGDLWNTRSTIELELARSGVDPGTRDDLRRQDVKALIEAAASERQPMVALLHLQEAAQLSQNFGFSDLREDATTRLQGFAGADMGLTRIEASVKIPNEVVDEMIRSIVEAPTWQGALVRLIASEPPSGRIEQNQALTDEISDNSPLASIIPVTRIGSDGLPRVTSASDEDRAANRLAATEMNRMQVHSAIYAEVLRQIGDRWAPIDVEELSTFLSQRSHVQEETARALAQSILRFFSGDAEGSCFTAIPRIERILRELLLKMGTPVFRPPVGPVPGHYIGLAVILEMLADRGFDESWRRFLGTLLVRQVGLNLRNETSHGSVDEVGAPVAALVLIAALYCAPRGRRWRATKWSAMNLAALIISGLSFVAVLLIGWRSISIGERSAKGSERAAEASVTAAQSTERSADASVRAADAAERSLEATQRAAEATERSVGASEHAAALAALDARSRRIEALLDTVLEMRQLFNQQNAAHENEVPPWVPGWHSPEALARLALCRQLEGRMVPFEKAFDASSAVRTLATTENWGNTHLEQASSEVKSILMAATPNGQTILET